MVIILKMSSRCNGTCVYCSAHTSQARHITMDVVEATLRLARERLEMEPRSRVQIILHGGEPLLLTSRFYEQILELVPRLLGDMRPRLSFAMQSNLTLLTERKAAVLKRLLDRPIGTSLDIFDGVRGIVGRVGLEERWYRGMGVARRAGLETGLVYVVHKPAVEQAERVYRFFRNHPLVSRIRYNPLYAEGRAKAGAFQELGISPADWASFLITLWRLWEQDGFRGTIAPLSEFRGAHFRGEFDQMTCSQKGRCFETHVGVDPDGQIFNCGRWSDTHELSFGRVQSTSWAELEQSPSRVRLAARPRVLREGACAACAWWSYCHGGCPNDAFLEHGTVEARSRWCAGYLEFFETCLRPHGPPRVAAGEGG